MRCAILCVARRHLDVDVVQRFVSVEAHRTKGAEVLRLTGERVAEAVETHAVDRQGEGLRPYCAGRGVPGGFVLRRHGKGVAAPVVSARVIVRVAGGGVPIFVNFVELVVRVDLEVKIIVSLRHAVGNGPVEGDHGLVVFRILLPALQIYGAAVDAVSRAALVGVAHLDGDVPSVDEARVVDGDADRVVPAPPQRGGGVGQVVVVVEADAAYLRRGALVEIDGPLDQIFAVLVAAVTGGEY